MFATLPVNALRTFESAARLRSFKLAAAELSVTPTAISHQIKVLEQQLGFVLFERLPRGVRLTEKGERLFAGVHGALLDVSGVLDALRPVPSAGSLCVSVTHSFAALWLVPRLGRFYQAYPHYLVRLEACAEVIDLQQDASVDIAVRYSRARYPALHQAARLEETFGVYAAPALSAADLQPPALIIVKWGDSALYETGWRDWCEAAGVDWWQRRTALRSYDEEHYALQAAVAGQGLVLASSVMVSDLVGNGLLVAHRPEIRVPGAAYSVLCAPGRERHPPVRAFLSWLQQELPH
ncbi:LysR substrate-binding domain-containing protein [Serratia entomophila]|uniref:LysR substrate-binding domain-containing protein n=1 Tax=Serratia entomophila TaxID=42906 RepID=UPI0021797834|nr:LysR substrate-binding domain-containing protein [Serratia entomophila]CAI0730262.1 Gcv operon activator [Serratia entomophila]CAI0848681.1 Gcv operon activator [Serratia entomophila]CAI1577464.1 Gcv operon activator [Serratia entomophila]CAI1663503.1 Gcv operon activator [Serratia entomophila]CAI1665462.1 Gcv operon activator [Serratia entomophila]